MRAHISMFTFSLLFMLTACSVSKSEETFAFKMPSHEFHQQEFRQQLEVSVPAQAKQEKKQENPSKEKQQEKEIKKKDSQGKIETKPQRHTSERQKKESKTSTGLNALEQEVVRLVNVERQKHGLPPLQLDLQVSEIAEIKSKDMKDNQYFSHHSPTYGSPFDMLKKFGVRYQAAGENIAVGYRTAREVMEGWMNSEGHRANILNPHFTHIGIGYVQGGSFGTYWTQLFIKK